MQSAYRFGMKQIIRYPSGPTLQIAAPLLALVVTVLSHGSGPNVSARVETPAPEVQTMPAAPTEPPAADESFAFSF